MTRVHDERGSALISAIVLVSVMLMLGLSTASLVDTQTQQSGRERTRESSLNLNEGVLYGQAFVLARNWPSASSGAAGAFPASCASTAATTPKCPDRDALAAGGAGRANFVAPDFQAGVTWTTKVRDNGGGLAAAYDPAQADAAQAGCPVSPCTLDANGDRRLWVQVSTMVRGSPRSVVALLALEEFREAFPKNAITAGSVTVTNSGNHGGNALVDVSGSQLAVRCTPPLASASNSSGGCIDFDRSTQISPHAFSQVAAGSPPALSPSQLQRLRDTARASGRLYDGSTTGCPAADADLSGAIVWVENCGARSFGSSLRTVPCPSGYPDMSKNGGCINTPEKPGVLIWRDGTLTLAGNDTFVGLVYAGNGQGSAAADPPVLTLEGGFQVYGAAAVEGLGRLAVGSNGGPNLKFYPNAFNGLSSYGTVGLVQNTWRELAPGA